MGVDGQLRLRRGAGGREDERRVLRRRVLDGARLPLPRPKEVVPRQLAVPRRAGRGGPPQDHDAFDVARPGIDGVVDDREEVDVLALAVGDVRRQDEARATRPDALAQRAGPEAGEHDAMDRPDPDGRQHRDDRLGRGRHVDRQAVALADPEAAKPCGDPLDLGEQLRVGEGAPSTPLVQRDQGRRLAPARRDVAIERVRGEVRPAAREPGEARPLARLECAVRPAGPVEPLGLLEPERLRVAERASIQLVVAGYGLRRSWRPSSRAVSARVPRRSSPTASTRRTSAAPNQS